MAENERPWSPERNQGFIQHLLTSMGHMDANDTPTFAKQLEYVYAETYDIEYDELLSEQILPVSDEVPEWAESITYRQWDIKGEAAIIRHHSQTPPMVDVTGKPFTSAPVHIGDAYAYSVKEMKAAAQTRVRLDVERARAAREVVDQRIDTIGAHGDAESGIYGFFNHPNIPDVTPVTGSWSAATSADNILGDINKLLSSVPIATRDRYVPDNLVLGTDEYEVCFAKRAGVDTDKNIIDHVVANWSKRTKSGKFTIRPWTRADLANAAGNGPRAVAYFKSPTVGKWHILKRFGQLPPQAENYGFKVVCEAIVGGLDLMRPKAFARMDGL